VHAHRRQDRQLCVFTSFFRPPPISARRRRFYWRSQTKYPDVGKPGLRTTHLNGLVAAFGGTFAGKPFGFPRTPSLPLPLVAHADRLRRLLTYNHFSARPNLMLDLTC
jgi:hypothetical protein